MPGSYEFNFFIALSGLHVWPGQAGLHHDFQGHVEAKENP